ncbi:MAG: hypothetical protein OXG24_03225 [Gammaproteobacteria bacterium]|nr:hypothetical protein [Gammaproteobacteria bacterium]
MIPSLVLFAWKRNQRIPVCIPIIVLWPFAFLVLLGTWFIGFCVPKFRDQTIKVRLAIVALARMRGLRVEIDSDESFFQVCVV